MSITNDKCTVPSFMTVKDNMGRESQRNINRYWERFCRDEDRSANSSSVDNAPTNYDP